MPSAPSFLSFLSPCGPECRDASRPELRSQAQALDQFLFSRGAAGLWLGIVLAALLSAYGLVVAGLSVLAAIATTLVFFAGLIAVMRRAWLRPEQFSGRRLRRLAALMIVASYASVIGSVAAGLRGPWDAARLLSLLWQATPLQLLVGIVVLLLMWVTATARRLQSQRELEHLKLVQERDAAARQASEAELKLLRAQIQPHFIFNTLSAVQHWVDTADPRASGLLRELTAFLRQSTELLARSAVTLRDEAALLGHYLAIMQARLGERLQYGLRLDPASLDQALPAGLLVTLAENAVEHGVAPALQGGRLEVQSRRSGKALEIVLLNTGLPLQEGWREGIGLANIRERLRHHFGARASLSLRSTPQGTEALVRLEDEA